MREGRAGRSAKARLAMVGRAGLGGLGETRRQRRWAGLQTRTSAMGGAPDCEANPCEGGEGRQTPLYVLQILGFSGLPV